jgi:hypothetical protein
MSDYHHLLLDFIITLTQSRAAEQPAAQAVSEALGRIVRTSPIGIYLTPDVVVGGMVTLLPCSDIQVGCLFAEVWDTLHGVRSSSHPSYNTQTFHRLCPSNTSLPSHTPQIVNYHNDDDQDMFEEGGVTMNQGRRITQSEHHRKLYQQPVQLTNRLVLRLGNPANEAAPEDDGGAPPGDGGRQTNPAAQQPPFIGPRLPQPLLRRSRCFIFGRLLLTRGNSTIFRSLGTRLPQQLPPGDRCIFLGRPQPAALGVPAMGGVPVHPNAGGQLAGPALVVAAQGPSPMDDEERRQLSNNAASARCRGNKATQAEGQKAALEDQVQLLTLQLDQLAVENDQVCVHG